MVLLRLFMRGVGIVSAWLLSTLLAHLCQMVTHAAWTENVFIGWSLLWLLSASTVFARLLCLRARLTWYATCCGRTACLPVALKRVNFFRLWHLFVMACASSFVASAARHKSKGAFLYSLLPLLEESSTSSGRVYLEDRRRRNRFE